MVEVKFSDKAIADIDNIAEYIAHNSPSYARKFVESVFKEVEILKTFPQIGRVLPEINAIEVREIFYQKYRIVYHIIDDQTIHIVTVQGSSRNFKNWFE